MTVSARRSRPSGRALWWFGLTAALFLVLVVSRFASSAPDGLEKVSGDLGFAETATTHASDGSPFAGYATRGVTDPWLSPAIAGFAGCVIVLAGVGGIIWVVRRRTDTTRERASS